MSSPAPGLDIGRSLVEPTLRAWGTDEQRSRLLPGIEDGSEQWCQLFSEPGSGSDLAGLSTRAVRDGDSWRVTGQKVGSTLAHLADWGILLARTDPDVPTHAGIRPLPAPTSASTFANVGNAGERRRGTTTISSRHPAEAPPSLSVG